MVEADLVRVSLTKDSGIDSIDKMIQYLREKAAHITENQWLIGYGYDKMALKEQRHPNRWDLENVSKTNPVVLFHTGDTICVCNRMALEIGHLLDGTIHYPMSDVYCDDIGELTGVIKDKAVEKFVECTKLFD